MSSPAVLTSWNEQHRALWGHQPLRLEHRLHQSPLFSREALSELIERYPRSGYALVHMGARGQRKLWREGDISGMRGGQVIDSIGQGRMWLNLRDVKSVDPRYGRLLEEIFAELAERIPGFHADTLGVGILISSPNAQVYYHADLPGQSLWQIAGRKKVYLYPAARPFLSDADLENIALFGLEIDMPYEDWYDDHARAFDLEPGQMLHWPLNAPHRVENYDCLNISMTVEYWTDEIRRAHKINLANGILRHRFGLTPRSRATHGPAYAGKAMLQKVFRDQQWVKRQRSARRPVDFRLDPARPGQIVDITGTGA